MDFSNLLNDEQMNNNEEEKKNDENKNRRTKKRIKLPLFYVNQKDLFMINLLYYMIIIIKT